MAPDDAELSAKTTAYLIHHIVLPPKLPQGDDTDPGRERVLLQVTISALEDFLKVSGLEGARQIETVLATITNLLNTRNDHGFLNESQLVNLMEGLATGITKGTIPLEVKAQNAAIIISGHEQGFVFEAFELSPSNESVTTTKGRLQRLFPAVAVLVGKEAYQEEGFQETFARTIAKMSWQPAKGFQPQARKAGLTEDEQRDTTHPGFVTNHIMNVLAAIGRAAESKQLWKNTREDVLWSNNKLPWRRSPLWLLIRVSMQLVFSRVASANDQADMYKSFLIFLLAKILDMARGRIDELGGDLVYATSAKLSRRLLKQGGSFQTMPHAQQWMDQVRLSMARAQECLEQKWEQYRTGVQVDGWPNTQALQELQPKADLDVALPRLDAWLWRMNVRKQQNESRDYQPTSTFSDFPPGQLPEPDDLSADSQYQYFKLLAFEAWVQHHLDQWLGAYIDAESTCVQLQRLGQHYHNIASRVYATEPISMSRMYLTIMELWVACDKSACQIYTFLHLYDPEIPIEQLQSLLLPFKDQMERLCYIEGYFHSRTQRRNPNSPSIYRDFGHPSSFAVKLFDQSGSHQSLMLRIKQDADGKRAQKCLELAQKQHEYRSLMQKHDSLACDMKEVVINRYYGSRGMRHDPACEKCKTLKAAKSIDIEIYEWPLPSNEAKAKATVFELMVPMAFGSWRDFAIFLTTDVLGSAYCDLKDPVSSYRLRGDHGLSQFLSQSCSSQRLVLLSQVKPFMFTHRREKEISNLREPDVCLPNGLQYTYFDDTRSVFTDKLRSTDTVSHHCMYRLPMRSSSLQAFLCRLPSAPDGTPPNSVIATQYQCPSHISLAEYKAFCALPLGLHIQYSNILTQLAIPSVDWSNVETHVLIRQIILHASPPSEAELTERVAHHILADEDFGMVMISQLRTAIQRITENWESWRALASFTQLTTRLFTLTCSAAIAAECLRLLEKCREICLDWLSTLKKRKDDTQDEEQRVLLCSRAAEIALVGISTFDVSMPQLASLLSCRLAASILLQFSIVVQENQDSTSSEHSQIYHSMLQGWRNLMLRALPTLKTECCEGFPLSDAVSVAWAGFRTQQAWQFTNPHIQHWLITKTEAQDSCPPVTVHFNLLTAELLVNGLPLARLPQEYLNHSMYAVLFSKVSVEVVPTTLPGFEFQAKHTFRGYELYFGRQKSDFLVQAVLDGRSLDLLPADVFEGHYPAFFVQDCIHWYDHQNEEVVFCHRDDPWTSSTSSHWSLAKVGARWRLTRAGVSLVDQDSDTARELSKSLTAIESRSYIHVLFDITSRSVSIDLPRLQLGFYFKLNGSNIYSRQFRGFIIDPNQKLDTLIGLSSKLVLSHDKADGDRMLLIPEGVVGYTKSTDHVSVCITNGTVRRVHTYQLDTILGCLKDNGSLQSKLFLSFLHALTSYCLPDPLTGHTGTESALSILRLGAVRSFDVLTKENISILLDIAKLTPTRTYYPRNERVMQKIGWDANLRSLSQHALFRVVVQEIFNQARSQKLFYSAESYVEPRTLDDADQDLLDRELIRSSNYNVSGFGAEQYSLLFDRPYTRRDGGQDCERGQRSYLTALLLLRQQAALRSPIQPSFNQTVWTDYLAKSRVQGLSTVTGPVDVSFDSKWLDAPSEWLSELWCDLHRSLSHHPGSYNKFWILWWLSTAAFAERADMDIIQTLMAFYKMHELSAIVIPQGTNLDLTQGYTASVPSLQSRIATGRAHKYYYPRWSCNVTKRPTEGNEEFEQLRQRIFENEKSEAIFSFACALEKQWPCERPEPPTGETLSLVSPFVDVAEAMTEVLPLFKIWYDNRKFYEYIENIYRVLGRQQVSPISLPMYFKVVQALPVTDKVRFVTTEHMFCHAKPPSLLDPQPLMRLPIHVGPAITQDNQSKARLSDLCHSLFESSMSKCEQDYIKDLKKSFQAFRSANGQSKNNMVNEDTARAITKYAVDCELYLNGLYKAVKGNLCDAAAGGKGSTGYLLTGSLHRYHSPRICPISLLQQLRWERWEKLSGEWRAAIVKYALAVTERQRSHRLVSFLNNTVQLVEDIQNVGHENWEPSAFPETLLLEADSGLLVRKVQEDIAGPMREPPNLQNAVMQLNMGEGKSSMIVPFVALHLADGTRLLRIVVHKAQFKQMRQMLISKVGGLLNRRVYYMPISRALRPTYDQAAAIAQMLRECLANRGILLLLPEHTLSFKLMGIESLLTGREEVGRSLLSTQQFLDEHSRDIVDESDENFSVKFELVYTMGTQLPIDFSPHRWFIIHRILDLVSLCAGNVMKDLPDSVELSKTEESGRFPRFRTLKSDGNTMLLDLIARHICAYGLPGFPIMRQPQTVREAVYRYITSPTLTPAEIRAVEHGPFWTDSTQSPLFLIRGLIAGGVLSFAFGSKRWRVNFGLDSGRNPTTKLAVPFRSKDTPTPRSEFSHPDVVIILTSLCYYYGGLDDEDLFDTFSHLLKSDQADIEYGEWVAVKPGIPKAFQHISGVNIKDRVQCVQHIFPALRYSKKAIDYFLSYIVFPKEMKEFPHKLSASGWDIGMVKAHPTTGFSGTNDSRHLLPLSVNHLDLPSQAHTNALVLSYLLQDENAVKILPPNVDSNCSNAEQILNVVNETDPAVRVILDAGAQILEMSNDEVARQWLSMSDAETTKGVVFFDKNEELSVMDRHGLVETLQVSPYAKQLNLCLIYLDEAHTRGTDLKLPTNYRAAVTLGAKVTKDKLVQACMRMRKLGKGHSVLFLVSEEIKSKILALKARLDSTDIGVTDIISWAISETWTDLRASMPLWATQGRRYESHKAIFQDKDFSKEQVEQFLEKEAQSLEYRYRPKAKGQSAISELDDWDMGNEIIARIVARCRDFGAMNFGSATLQEEQERELSPEIEAERQIERPAQKEAEPHHIHPDLMRLVQHGHFDIQSTAFLPAFESLRTTSAITLYDLKQFPKDLLVTVDFARTVKLNSPSDRLDSYQRPVQWILSVPVAYDSKTVRLIILSPFEANGLLPAIRQSSKVTLHVYSPRPTLGYRPLDSLDLYTVGRPFNKASLSRSSIVQLNLFAGQLYLRSYSEYIELCNFLGLAWSASKDGENVRADGFFSPPKGEWNLQFSPVEFLKVFITNMRRDCQSIAKTHMGRILDGGLLEEKDFVGD